jgi:hypothetical protein
MAPKIKLILKERILAGRLLVSIGCNKIKIIKTNLRL